MCNLKAYLMNLPCIVRQIEITIIRFTVMDNAIPIGVKSLYQIFTAL